METMEKKPKKMEKFSQSNTAKGLVIGIITLLLLIPSSMIESLISERQTRSRETIENINAKWSTDQTISGPVLTIPYLKTYVENKKTITEAHYFNLTPEELKIHTRLLPEEKHYGIYKAILYKSEVNFSGHFAINPQDIGATKILWDESYITIGISDLRGVQNNLNFILGGTNAFAESSGNSFGFMGQSLVLKLKNGTMLSSGKPVSFDCKLMLNGSSSINYIPMGKTTDVNVEGNWPSPGFIGSFSPEHSLTKGGFVAKWHILHFNRNIPENWIDNDIANVSDSSFGVNLVDTVDQYQQNMRSAKYALMFIALTFVVFFFVEVLTKKRIHPIQYMLVGIALILFYSLLLSISEQIGFGWAYVIASIATIALIVAYAHSIFKNKTQTGILMTILSVLYVFLYVILQLEDIALLIGSVGLFLVLGIIMFISKKINWYKQEELEA